MAPDESCRDAAVNEKAAEFRDISRNKSRKLFFASCAAFVLLVALAPGSVRAAWARLAGFISVGEEPIPSAPLSNFDLPAAKLSGLSGQQQAELLMNATINRDPRAAVLVTERAQQWRGRLKLTPELTGTLQTALNDHDLKARAAALEVYLAVYNVAKTPRSAAHLREVAQTDLKSRGWALWMLGALGNRGIDGDAALNTLLAHIHDSDEQTRYWTIEGLAHLGSDATIAPLVDEFRNDPAKQVRERAASSLAESGMLTHEQRLHAVPALIATTNDPAADQTTKEWAYQALGAITGKSFGKDSAAWQTWSGNHGN
jgi:HEAT repeat protein